MDTTHRCTEKECPFVGQVTSKSCRCHKTAEQMLAERVEELEAALDVVRIELAALTANPGDHEPYFGLACPNTADAECVGKAYVAACDAFEKAEA